MNETAVTHVALGYCRGDLDEARERLQRTELSIRSPRKNMSREYTNVARLQWISQGLDMPQWTKKNLADVDYEQVWASQERTNAAHLFQYLEMCILLALTERNRGDQINAKRWMTRARRSYEAAATKCPRLEYRLSTLENLFNADSSAPLHEKLHALTSGCIAYWP